VDVTVVVPGSGSIENAIFSSTGGGGGGVVPPVFLQERAESVAAITKTYPSFLFIYSNFDKNSDSNSILKITPFLLKRPIFVVE